MDVFAAGILFGMCLGVLWADREKARAKQSEIHKSVRWQNLMDQVEVAYADIERISCRRRHPSSWDKD